MASLDRLAYADGKKRLSFDSKYVFSLFPAILHSRSIPAQSLSDLAQVGGIGNPSKFRGGLFQKAFVCLSLVVLFDAWKQFQHLPRSLDYRNALA